MCSEKIIFFTEILKGYLQLIVIVIQGLIRKEVDRCSKKKSCMIMWNLCCFQRIMSRRVPILCMLHLPIRWVLMDVNFHTHGTTQCLMTHCMEQCRKYLNTSIKSLIHTDNTFDSVEDFGLLGHSKISHILMSIKITIFWNVMPYSLVDSWKHV